MSAWVPTGETVEQTLERLRASLQPRGSLPLVRLALRNHGFVDSELVAAAVDEMERVLTASRTDGPNALERLAVLLLLESAQ